MAKILDRLNAQTWNLTWNVPYSGFIGGVIGATYAHFAAIPLEKTAKAYAVWFAVQAAFKCLARVITDEPKKIAMLDVGVGLTLEVAAIQKLRAMGLMGQRMTIAIIFINVIWASDTLQKHGLV